MVVGRNPVLHLVAISNHPKLVPGKRPLLDGLASGDGDQSLHLLLAVRGRGFAARDHPVEGHRDLTVVDKGDDHRRGPRSFGWGVSALVPPGGDGDPRVVPSDVPVVLGAIVHEDAGIIPALHGDAPLVVALGALVVHDLPWLEVHRGKLAGAGLQDLDGKRLVQVAVDVKDPRNDMSLKDVQVIVQGLAVLINAHAVYGCWLKIHARPLLKHRLQGVEHLTEGNSHVRADAHMEDVQGGYQAVSDAPSRRSPRN